MDPDLERLHRSSESF